MDEIFQICSEVAVLRDGRLTLAKNINDTNMNELISAMVGRSLEKRFPDVDNEVGEDYFEVRNITTRYEPQLKDISFTVKKGEILNSAVSELKKNYKL